MVAIILEGKRVTSQGEDEDDELKMDI